jgi:hypothetical protein
MISRVNRMDLGLDGGQAQKEVAMIAVSSADQGQAQLRDSTVFTRRLPGLSVIGIPLGML